MQQGQASDANWIACQKFAALILILCIQLMSKHTIETQCLLDWLLDWSSSLFLNRCDDDLAGQHRRHITE